MLWDAWIVVCSLKKHISFVFSRIKEPQPAFPFLFGLDKEQKDTFCNMLEKLSQSLLIRFACPSQSIDKRRLNPSHGFEYAFHPTSGPEQPSLQCSLSKIFDVLCDQNITNNDSNIRPMISPELSHEIELAKMEIGLHPELLNVQKEKTVALPKGLGLLSTQNPHCLQFSMLLGGINTLFCLMKH